MAKKGEKMSDEHKKKMAEGRKKKAELRNTPPKTEIISNQLPNLPANPANGEKVIPDPEAKPEVERKGVQASGETKTMEAQNFIMNENTGPSAAISAQLPGQAEQIKKELKRKVPKIAKVDPTPPDVTTRTLTTDDPKAISARAPFSFNALRMKLAVG